MESNDNTFEEKLSDLNDYEINNLQYEIAKKIDNRSFCQIYFSLLKNRHILILTFYTKNDYNSRAIKICLFLFYYSLLLTINALFYSTSSIHDIYISKGEFNFIYQLPKIIYSSLISCIINSIITYFSLTQKYLLELKNKIKKEPTDNSEKIINKFKIRFIIFFVLYFLLLIFFWYYISCFCSVYVNTQLHLIKDSLISFGTTLFYPFLLSLIPTIFRIQALKDNNDNNQGKEYLFKISKLLQNI